MDVNSVISQGDIGYFQSLIHYSWWWIWIVLCVVCIFLARHYHNKIVPARHFWEEDEGPVGRFMLCTAIWALSILAFLAGGLVCMSNRQDIWTSDVAYPYINSLPWERHEIKYIKIQDVTQEDGTAKNESSYTETHVLVLYDNGDGRIVRLDITANINMSLGDSERPYIEFQRLTQDLGNDVNAGLWNYNIYLPEHYQFDTIK